MSRQRKQSEIHPDGSISFAVHIMEEVNETNAEDTAKESSRVHDVRLHIRVSATWPNAD
jgi:hypothetical protein